MTSGRRVRPLLVVVLLNTAYVAGSLVLLRLAADRGIGADELLRDPVAVVGAPLHTGLLSHAGVLVWCLGAGVCLMASAALRGTAARAREAQLLLYAGLLTLAVAVDDLLLVHEGLAPTWFGVPEKAVLAVYAVAALALLLSYRTTLLQLVDLRLLVVSALALLGSTAVDVVSTLAYRPEEDLLKAVGALNWTLAWSSASVRAVRGAVLGAAAEPRQGHDSHPAGTAPPAPRRRTRLR